MLGTPKEIELSLGLDDSADHANVVINYIPPALQATQNFYAPTDETGILKTQLYEGVDVIPTKPEGDWRYDYVEAVYSITEVDSDVQVADELRPAQTTEYEVTIGMVPTKKASNTNVVEVQEDKTSTVFSIIIVGHEVVFDLTELTHDHTSLHGKYVAEVGKDFIFTLTPAEGVVLPDSISVSVGGNEIPEGDGSYFYDRVSGKVIIREAAITDNVTVTAAAKAKSYHLYFVYGDSPDATEYHTVTETFEAGSDISGAFHSTYVSDVEGYDFSWDWGDGSTQAPAQMPANDLWVTGVYTAKEYKVSVRYGYDNSSESGIIKELNVRYGEDYSVPVPEKSGYVPYLDGNITTTVSGTMGAEDVTVTVTYKATSNTLTVIYRYADGSEAYPTETYQYNTDYKYSIAVKTLEGYTQSSDGVTPDNGWTTIDGIMTAGGATVVVTYLPNTYKVIFDYNDGVTVSTEKLVTYNEIYGYDADGAYSPFDIPLREHYVFEGWYLGETKVAEDTVVNTAADHTLTAKWSAYEYTLTVKYVYADGAAAYMDHSGKYAYQEPYKVDSPDLHGYTPDKDPVEGNMPGQDFIVTVTYTYNYSGELVIKASVEWDGLSFDYVPFEWNPETLTNERIDQYTPKRADCNKITVSNNGSYIDTDGTPPITIYADFTYASKEGYEGVSGYFTDSGSADGTRVVDAEVANDGSESVYFWLEGGFTPPAKGSYGIGSCTVTIRGGEKETQ